MPRWPDVMLGGSFFVFPTREDANKGRPVGGCGFFVGIPWESDPQLDHVYAITCDHVVPKGKPRVIRAARPNESEPYFIDCSDSDWIRSEPDDLAVSRIEYGVNFAHESFLLRDLTESIILDYSIGIGDEVFSPGRFVDLPGHRVNRPLVRSGIISGMPEIPIQQRGGVLLDSYIVEMRSRSGFSGSPVYVYLAPPQIRYEQSERQIQSSQQGNALIKDFGIYGPWLLGVHWGEIPVQGPDAPTGTKYADQNTQEGGVELGSGMIGVVPCKKLAKLLLEDERVVEERRSFEREAPPSQMMKQSAPPTKGDNPRHREDFNSLLTSVAKGKKQED
jgi:hypothetical protein